jgi:hypothetical protein
VELMLVAAGAVLLPFDALRMEALVLHGEVVAVLTLAAGEDDLLSWHGSKLLVKSVRVGLFRRGAGNLGCSTRRPDTRRALVDELLLFGSSVAGSRRAARDARSLPRLADNREPTS